MEVPRVQVKLDLQEITLSPNDIFHCYLDFLSDLVITDYLVKFTIEFLEL